MTHTLWLILSNLEKNEAKLAKAFYATDAEDTTEVIVESVTAVRDRLDLPRRLRAIDEVTKDKFQEIVESAYDDALVQNAPLTSNQQLKRLRSAPRYIVQAIGERFIRKNAAW